jgi:uncharacterized protein YbgA (DUF1722 family)
MGHGGELLLVARQSRTLVKDSTIFSARRAGTVDCGDGVPTLRRITVRFCWENARRQALSTSLETIFARSLLDRFPLLPVEEEGRLHDLPLRENFVERVFCYRRWRDLKAGGLTRGKLVAFHTVHKLLLMAHSPKHYTEMGRLVADAKTLAPRELESRYGALFMAGLKVKATAKKHVNVLQHILGYLKRDLDDDAKAELLAVIGDYHRELVPLVVPLTLLKHHLARVGVPYVQEQVYLYPHPKELMLRNHV